MIKGGFINNEPFDKNLDKRYTDLRNKKIKDLNVWNDNTKQFEILNWNHPDIIMIISDEICKKKQNLTKELNIQKEILLNFAQYFGTKQEITDVEIINFVRLFNQYQEQLKNIINSIAYNKKTPLEQEQINNNCIQLLNSISIKLNSDYFTNFRNEALKNKQIYKKLSNLIIDLEKIKNYQQNKNIFEKVKNEEKIYFNYYEKKDLETFIKEDLDIKKDVRDKIFTLTKEYNLNKYAETYKSLMPINLNNINEIADILININPPGTNILIVKKEELIKDGINRIFLFEIYNNKDEIVDGVKIFYEFDSENFSIKKLFLNGNEEIIEKEYIDIENNIILYPYIKKKQHQQYNYIETILISGMSMSKSKKSIKVSNYYLELLEKYYISFLETFLGTPRIDEIKYFTDYRALFLAFIYSSKLKSIFEIFNGSSEKIFNLEINDEKFESFININKVIDDIFLRNYKEFGSRKESFLNELNKIYPDNLKFNELYELIYNIISNDIVVYYNYIIQQNIINENYIQSANEEQNIRKFKDTISKLNNSILYCFDIVKDYIVVKLIIGCVYYNILLKYIDKKYMLGLVYSFILDYICNEYNSISNIVNTNQINYNLIGYYTPIKTINEFNIDNNLLYILEKTYPSIIGPPNFDYQHVEKIKIQGKDDIYPCVEMWLFNFIIYLIYGEQKFKDMIIPNNPNNPNNPNQKIRIQDINPELLPSSTKQELKDVFIKSNNNGNIIYYTKNEIDIISKTNEFQKYYKAIHNVLTPEQMAKLNNNLTKTRYNNNIDSYYITPNIKEQNELPGRFSFLCLILSKIFGLEGIYSTDVLLEEKNFLNFYDFNENAKINKYPNDTIIILFKLFPTYQYKLLDNNFKTDNFMSMYIIENNNIGTYIKPEHGHFEYKNIFIDQYNYGEHLLDIFSYEMNNSINYNLFNERVTYILFNNINKYYNYDFNNYLYIYNKNFFDIVAIDFLNMVQQDVLLLQDIKLPITELLDYYNADNKIEYLNLFSNVYYKNLDKFDKFDNRYEITNKLLTKIVSIDFDNVNKYPKNKFNKCWLSIEDLKKQSSNINNNLIISIDNFKKKSDNKNSITTSYITSELLFDIISILDNIQDNIDNNIFNNSINLYLLLLLNNDIDKILLKKIIENIEEEHNIFIILVMVYYFHLFSQNNYKKLLDVINELKGGNKNVKKSLIIIIIIMFMPYKFDEDINKYISYEEKKELEKINILSFISNKIQKNEDTYNIYYNDKIQKIHKIYNIDVLEKIFGKNFNLNNQQHNYKFVKYQDKDGNNIPKIKQEIFNLDGSDKLELNGKVYKNYIQYLYIFNRVQSEIISKDLLDNFILTKVIYNSNITLNYISKTNEYLLQTVFISDFFNDEKNVRIINRFLSDVKILSEKNIDQQFNDTDSNYKILYSYQKIMTEQVNNVLLQDKFASNIFNFHYVIYETFKDTCDKYINNILTIEELIKQVFTNKNILTSQFNYDEKFLCEFKENFRTNIKLVFKGGSAMNIIFEKYNILFKKNIEFNNYIEKFKDDFMRSDADYIILINKKNIRKQYPTFNEKDLNKIYNLYYYHLNFIVYMLILQLRDKYQDNINFYYDFNKINYNDLDNSLEKLNKQLKKNNLEYPDSEYSIIKKFIGINFYNRNYIKEKIDTQSSIVTFDNNKILYPINFGHSGILNKYPISKTNDIIITYKHINEFSQKYIKKYKHEYFIIESRTNNEKNYIFIITNETHQYKTWNNKTINFISHTLKLNSLLYFSFDENSGKNSSKKSTERYGYLDNPVEILDISIPKYNDSFNTDTFDIDENVEENIYLHPFVGKFKYYTYTSKGYIKDLYLNLCVSNKYIWDDYKYNKRLNRLIFFIIIELITLPNNLNIINDICDLLENQNEYNLSKIKSYLPELYIDIYNFFETIYNYSKEPEYDVFKDKYIIMIKILLEKFTELKKVKDFDKIVSPTKDELYEIRYLNKYIKYKNKYNLLKNQYAK
jgi:hypothetical protein